MKLLILIISIFSINSYARVLPSIFYVDQANREAFCANKSYHNEHFWRALMGNKITELSTNRIEAAQNSFVTQSYLELFRKTHHVNGVKFMGYIYANASHHLGRLVRYNAWPDNHDLKEYDRSFVEGPALRTLAQLANSKLSPKLMSYSKDLYQELSWSLGAASLCGNDYTLNMLTNSDLISAFRATNIPDFIKSFVRYEQSYLHKKMYQDIEIKLPAKSTVLDKMRYMSFNGQKQTSFAQWCAIKSCGTSSYNLENRISYDVWAITKEYHLTKASTKSLNIRMKNAKIEVTADYFSRN